MSTPACGAGNQRLMGANVTRRAAVASNFIVLTVFNAFGFVAGTRSYPTAAYVALHEPL
ncbi:MAG TPA: hypothetical protein VEG65_05350 [Candidatus Bathyarchaeia archaeon]|nr:hypothetical protein [Candidatus Bathyarchaeia archaeon]